MINMSLTADIDVAPLIRYGKRNGLRFYPTMLWVVPKAEKIFANLEALTDADLSKIRQIV